MVQLSPLNFLLNIAAVFDRQLVSNRCQKRRVAVVPRPLKCEVQFVRLRPAYVRPLRNVAWHFTRRFSESNGDYLSANVVIVVSSRMSKNAFKKQLRVALDKRQTYSAKLIGNCG